MNRHACLLAHFLGPLTSERQPRVLLRCQITKKAMATTKKTAATATILPRVIGRSVHIAIDAACALASPYRRGRFCLAGHWSVYHSDCLPNKRRHKMAARAGIAWVGTNLLDVQRIRQVHNHQKKESGVSAAPLHAL